MRALFRCDKIQEIFIQLHYHDVIMGTIASQIISLTVVYSIVYSDAKKTPKLRVTGLCVGNSPGPVNSPHKGPVMRKIFPFDDVIMLRWQMKPVRALSIIPPVCPALLLRVWTTGRSFEHRIYCMNFLIALKCGRHSVALLLRRLTNCKAAWLSILL